MKDVKAIFFDLDDTLICFGGVTIKSWELTCERLINEGILDTNPQTLANQIIIRKDEVWNDEEKSKEARKDLLKSREAIVTQAFKDLNIDNQEAINFILTKYDIYRTEAIHLFDHVHETLTELKARNYKIALITNGSGIIQRGKLERFGLEHYFDLLLIESEQPFGKPDERIYKKALNFFGIQPHDACMVGDHYLWEVVAPIKLGIKGVWNNFDYRELPDGYDIKPSLIIHNVSELLNYL